MATKRFNFQRPAPRRQGTASRVQTQNVAIKKLVNASDRFGNPGIKNGQWTTTEIYDYLPYAPGSTLTFFENVNTRTFPFTNISQNELQVGESMVIKRVWFTMVTVVAGIISNILTFEQGGLTAQYLSQFSWFNDNNRVIKPISLTNMQSEFNRKGWSTDNNVFHLETDITIQPLVRFTCQLKLVPGAAIADVFIGCHVGGMGTILAPKGTY